MARIVIIGDIHACYEELNELLDHLSLTSGDRLISVGDLICKGPDTARTLDLAMTLPNLTCVVGNHELRFLKEWRSNRVPGIKPYDLETVHDMGERFEAYMNYIDEWPFFVETSECLVVHAGLRPSVRLERQSAEDLTSIRYLDPGGRPWYEFYKEDKPVIFGHWVRREPLLLENVVGLDTGCVYGGKLSAYVFPDRQIVSVKARRAYRIRKKPWDI